MGLHPATGAWQHWARLAVDQPVSRGPVSRTALGQGQPQPSRRWTLGPGINLLAVEDWAGEPGPTEEHFRRKIDSSLRSRLPPQGGKTERSKTAQAFATEKFQISLISLLGTFTIVPVQMRPLDFYKLNWAPVILHTDHVTVSWTCLSCWCHR